MINKFMKFFQECANVKQSLVLTLEWDKCADWFCEIKHRDSGVIVFSGDSHSLNLLAAQGYLALEEWAREYNDTCDIESNL